MTALQMQNMLDGKQVNEGLHGQLVLDTLSIKLDQPAKAVKIDGLHKMWFLSTETQKM